MLHVFTYSKYRLDNFFNLFRISSRSNCTAMKKVIVSHDESEKTLLFTLKYVNDKFNVNRIFNFKRKTCENCEQLLVRVSENIKKVVAKKLRTKDTSEIAINARIIKDGDRSCDVKSLTCLEAASNGTKFLLEIESIKYAFDFNPPILRVMDLPKRNIMSGCLLYPIKIDTTHCDNDHIRYKWFRSSETFKNIDEAKSKMKHISWEEIGDESFVTLSTNEVSRLIKVVGTPFKGDRMGEPLECVSNVLVSSAPDKFGFSERHLYTSEVLEKDCLRVVSYNILADLYADSEFSRTNLFPCCPPYALQIDYRKQLILKELIGYNADVICLQEVDEKVFRNDLYPVLSRLGFDGTFKTKGGPSVSEGLATFYRSSKLKLKEVSHFMLGEELQTNPIFSTLLDYVKSNEKVFDVFVSRPTILQVTVYESVEAQPRVLVVGSTHLYFDPLSDHIRLLQAHVCLTILRQIVQLQKVSDCDVSLLFCGDFNSAPENAVYRLMTSQLIDDDDPDWTSKPEEEMSGLSLNHDLEISSACGTPQFTNYTVGFKGCLDYIFYQADKFSLMQSVPLPNAEELAENEALPSVKFPSDHVALVADLRWSRVL